MSEILFHMVEGGPRPVAPFSHAVEAGGFVAINLVARRPSEAPLPETRA